MRAAFLVLQKLTPGRWDPGREVAKGEAGEGQGPGTEAESAHEGVEILF